MQENKVGLIGLGNMGQGICTSLLRAGFEVYGIDLSEKQRQAAQEKGVNLVEDFAQLCSKTQIILLSLPAAKHVKEVVMGEQGLLHHAAKGSLIIDTSTSEPEVTRALAVDLENAQMSLLDAPLSGGPAGAAAGTMVIVVGGAEADLVRATPVFDALSSRVVHLGGSGSGHTAKLINNLLCAAHLISTAEAVALGEKAGLDPEKLLKGLNSGSGRSAVSEVNFPRWILNDEFNSGFTMQLMRKDVGLALQLVEQMGLDLPLSQLVGQQWADSKETQADEEDFNCIVKTVSKGGAA